MKGGRLCFILGLSLLTLETVESFFFSGYKNPLAFGLFEPILESNITEVNLNDSLTFDDYNEPLGENQLEIDEDFFTEIGSVTDLQTLLERLGIEEDLSDPAPVYREPEASRTRTSSNLEPSSKNNDRPEISFRTKSNHQSKYLRNPKEAHCIPEVKVVDLGLEKDDPNVNYYPRCIRINRCGGCCPRKDILECQPIASDKVVVQVFELKMHNPSRIIRKRRGRRGRRSKVKVNHSSFNISVEEHTKCACMCKITETDCDLRIQSFDSGICSCKCSNVDELNKCYNKRTHRWDSKNCKCQCKTQKTCSTGKEFDNDTCLCTYIRSGLNWRDYFLGKSTQVLRKQKPISVPLHTMEWK